MTENKKTIILFFFLFGIIQLPLWSVRIPPLVDYPNHLARMHILANLDGSQTLREFYEIRWAVLPNLAMDIIVPFLCRFMTLESAGRSFISLLFFLLSGGVFALHYALHRRISFWPLLSFLFIYNRPFLWGFMNFLFGIGLSLWILAAWIYFRDSKTLLRLSVFSLLTLILFFCHLFALGVYGLCILGYELYRLGNKLSPTPWPDGITAFVPFILPAILLLFFSPTATTAASHEIIFGQLIRKISAVVQPVNNYNAPLDICTFLILFGPFVLGIFFRKIEIAKPIIGPLALLALFFCIMPEVLFTVQCVDTRMPTPFVFLLIAGSKFSFPDLTLKWKQIIVAGLFIIFSARTSIIFYYWQQSDQKYGQYMAAFDKMDTGSRLFTAVPFTGPWIPFPTPISHIPCIAIIRKSAFIPSLFAFSTQQPVVFKKKYQELAIETPEPFKVGLASGWESLAENYDYLLVVKENRYQNKLPEKFEEIYKGNNFRLLKTDHATTE